MDPQKLTELLRATIDPNPEHRKAAEDQLAQIHKIIGFAPTILQIVMQNTIENPVRQAGALYLKNLVKKSWGASHTKPGEPMPFTIHEQDRAMIRGAIVDAIVHAPDIIKVQLAVIIHTIISYDFPGRWPQVVDNISIYLQNPDVNGWSGALITLHTLVKTYEYKSRAERGPLNDAMGLLLRLVYQIMINIINDPTEQSVLLQKQILKTYYALTQFALPLEIITKEIFSDWMEICKQVVERPVPDCSHIDDDDKPKLPWWKAKKWALHILDRLFERYGCPRTVRLEYQEFAEWYLPTFTPTIINVLLKILDQYRNGTYVSPRVISDIFSYLKTAVSNAFSWKIIKHHIIGIVQHVIFPLLTFSDADQELWDADPREFIRYKYNYSEEYASPALMAQVFLVVCCRKRRGILPKVMTVIMQIITTPNIDNKQKDGALHMIGGIAEVLLRTKAYRDQIEQMIVTYVFPELRNPAGHLRGRACWVLQYFGDLQIKNPAVVAEIVNLTTNCLLNDKDLPVRVEAAIALQRYLTSHSETCHSLIERKVKDITIELLNIIKETENEDLINVLHKLVCTYSDELVPVATEICQKLVTTFSQVLESEEESDDKAIVAMSILNNIETLLNVMEDHPEVMNSLYPVVMQVVVHVLQNNISDFYEETFSLVYYLTSKSITPEIWQLLELIYQVFKKDGFEYFIDIMPVLHNYVTVDTPAFLSNPNRLLAMFDMCKTLFTRNVSEDPEIYAAKLLEVILLQCKGQIDSVIPMFVELVLSRLTREIQGPELRTMCLQVVIAALYYNPQLLLSILEKLSQQTNNEPIVAHFVKQWLLDTDFFLGIHDRKLCVLGLCTLMSLGNAKPPVLSEISDKIIPSLILLFDGLKRAYEARAQEEEEEEEEEDFDNAEEALSSDEDEVDEYSNQDYLTLSKMVKEKGAAAGFDINAEVKDDDDEDSEEEEAYDDERYETPLETYTTPIDEEETENAIDEYMVFKEVISSISTQEQAWYALLTNGLTAEQANSLKEILVTADQRKAAKDSKRIEKQGGFAFTQQTVPSSFKFGS